MKKFMLGLLVVVVLGAGGYYAYTTMNNKEEPKEETRKTSVKTKDPEKAGETIKATDYSDADNWLAKPTEITNQADVDRKSVV